MRVRYAIIAHRDPQALKEFAARAEAVGLDFVGQRGLAAVFCDSAATDRSDGPIYIIGSLYGSDTQMKTPLPANFTTLNRDFWGAYIALSSTDRAVSLLRDPSGGQTCYHAGVAGGLLVSSDITTLEKLASTRFNLSWDDVDAVLRSGDLPMSKTALAGVSELLPGRILRWSPDKRFCETLWHPRDHVDKRAKTSFEDNAASLRDSVMKVIGRLGAETLNALVTVSGGLDSSIVAAALASAGQSVTCLTVATQDPSGDERRYARQIAKHIAAPLIESFFDSSHVDLSVSHAAALPRPVGRAFAQSLDALVSVATRVSDADAVFHGTGGDNVFGMLQSAAPVADRILQKDFGGAFKTSRDLAQLHNVSIGAAMSSGVATAFRWRGRYEWRSDDRFLVMGPAHTSLPSHHWLQGEKNALPGQLGRIASLLRIQNHLDTQAVGTATRAVTPLLAQPIVELCLAIPSWQWCQGGRDRAVARHAFADHLPQAILRRRWKGGPDGFIGLLVERNRGFLKERLCNGLLAQHNIVDYAAVEDVLADPSPPSATDALRLLALADAEAWVRNRF